MSSNDKPPVLVVLQLTGGNDYLNTVIPYNDANYYDNRPGMKIPQDTVIKLDDELGLHPAMGPIAEMYRQNNVAVIHGIGYENSLRSHFRSMDIWHTCEPDRVSSEGWLGRAIRDLDPDGANPVTGVNVGQGLPRALVAPGVSVSSVSDLDSYGLLSHFQEEKRREEMLSRFVNMYAPAVGMGLLMDYLGQMGLDALNGAEILKSAPRQYASSVEYGDNSIARCLRDVAKIHTAGLGTRVFYTQHGSFDTHAGQAPIHTRLWREISEAIRDFWADLQEHDAAGNVIMILFSEFGRRVRDNGSGTDHGSAGVAFVIGPSVRGGMYSEYPDTRAEALDQGDLAPNVDFRGVYSSILERWFGLDAKPIVNGQFEQLNFIGSTGGTN